MTSLDDAAKVSEIATDTIPVVLSLISSVAKIINSQGDTFAERDALMSAAEAVKRRLDELKFPNEPQE